MNETKPIDLSNCSPEELEAALAKSRKKAAKKREAEKLAYEEARDDDMAEIIKEARELSGRLFVLKQLCHAKMEKQEEALKNYGSIKKSSKGGFTLKNSDDSYRITRRRDTKPSWDERSEKAIELLKDFLLDTVKKRDVKLYEILMSFLEKNAKGDLEYSRVMDLIKHEDKFDDARWHEGLQLIKESYSNHLRAYGYDFKVKKASGDFERIVLNFSSL